MAVARMLAGTLVCLTLLLLVACESKPYRAVVPVGEGAGQARVTNEQPNDAKPLRNNSPAIVFTLTDRAVKEMQAGNWTAAQRSLEQALRIAPNEAQVYLVYGDFYQRQDQYQQARQMFYRAISVADEHSGIARQAQARLQSLPD